MRRIKEPNQKKKKCGWVRDIFKNRERQAGFETLFRNTIKCVMRENCFFIISV